MKLDKTNVCVKIVDEQHLQQARELLERYGEVLSSETGFYEGGKNGYNRLANFRNVWELMYLPHANLVTLSELEEILKEEV